MKLLIVLLFICVLHYVHAHSHSQIYFQCQYATLVCKPDNNCQHLSPYRKLCSVNSCPIIGGFVMIGFKTIEKCDNPYPFNIMQPLQYDFPYKSVEDSGRTDFGKTDPKRTDFGKTDSKRTYATRLNEINDKRFNSDYTKAKELLKHPAFVKFLKKKQIPATN